MLHRETSAYTATYRRPAEYFYVTDFRMMSNWNIAAYRGPVYNRNLVISYTYLQ